MAVHNLFPKIEEASLFEYSGESNYEPYSGIVLDPDDNLFKTVSGMFRDKKDFYEKLKNRGYVVRKVFEKKVFDWIEENAKTTLEAYLMFSTAFSKWKGNNLLDQYYTKLLNDIPQLNREKIKGNPNTRGKEDIMADESVFTEAVGNYTIRIIPIVGGDNGERNWRAAETYDTQQLNIDWEFLNTLPNGESPSNEFGKILANAEATAQENGTHTFLQDVYYELNPEKVQTTTGEPYKPAHPSWSHRIDDKDGKKKPLIRFFEVQVCQGKGNYATPMFSVVMDRNRLNASFNQARNLVGTGIANKSIQAAATKANQAIKAQKNDNFIASMDDLDSLLNIANNEPNTAEDIYNKIDNNLGQLDLMGTGNKNYIPRKEPREYKRFDLQATERLFGPEQVLNNEKDNYAEARKILLVRYCLDHVNQILEYKQEGEDKLHDALVEQDRKNLADIYADINICKEYDEEIEQAKNQPKFKNLQGFLHDKLLEKNNILKKYAELDPEQYPYSKQTINAIRSYCNKIIHSPLNTNTVKFTNQNDISTFLKRQNVKTGGYRSSLVNNDVDLNKDNAAIDQNKKLYTLTKNTTPSKDYVRNPLSGYLHKQIKANQDKRLKGLEDMLANAKSSYAKKVLQGKIDALKDKLANKESVVEAREDVIPEVDEIRPGKHVNYNASQSYANEPVDGVVTNPGAIPTSGHYMYEQDQHWGWIHQDLNQELFDGTKLRPEVREALLRIAEKFRRTLGLSLEPIDIYFTGSSANFNYNESSDIDLHLVYDFEEIGINAEILIKYFIAKKEVFNKDYEISIKGLPVEVGVENLNEPIVTSAIYSVKQDKWLLEPEYAERLLPQPDMELYYKTIQDIEKAIETRDSKEIGVMWDKLYKMRKQSLADEGEYGKGNAMFKKLRNLGYLDRLKNAYYNSASEELSLESLKEIL